MKNINKHLEKKLKNPEFAKFYEIEMQKLEITKTIIDYRIKKIYHRKN